VFVVVVVVVVKGGCSATCDGAGRVLGVAVVVVLAQPVVLERRQEAGRRGRRRPKAAFDDGLEVGGEVLGEGRWDVG
jgi:hypothetical protein